jgi:sugar phosphate isomerase/epimerase
VIGLTRLSMNQATVSQLNMTQTLDLCQRHEIPAVGLWRHRVAELGLGETAASVRRRGLHVSSLCRGGFFTHAEPDARRAALADNLAAVEEAAALRADTLVLVSGGLVAGTRDLGLARRMIADAIAALVPRARELGVRLGIEPLHPMFCADRCVLTRLADAVELALLFPADTVGVVVDTYHVWWDSQVADDIARARGRIVAYQLCDWVVPLPRDMLLGRGHLGDGSINFRPISAQVLAAGFDGFIEVEIMNQDVWDAPASQTAATVKARFAELLG